MMIRIEFSPEARAAVTNSFSLMESTIPRITRASPAHPMKLMMSTIIRYTSMEDKPGGNAARNASIR